MKTLRILVYLIIILGISKLTNGNSTKLHHDNQKLEIIPQYNSQIEYEVQNTLENINNDSLSYLNIYSSHTPLSNKPLYFKLRNETVKPSRNFY